MRAFKNCDEIEPLKYTFNRTSINAVLGEPNYKLI